VPDDLCIEGIARYAHSRVTHDVACDSASLANGWANMNQGKITGTTAEIPYENEFVMIKHGFVIMSRCYRLHFERYGLIAS